MKKNLLLTVGLLLLLVLVITTCNYKKLPKQKEESLVVYSGVVERHTRIINNGNSLTIVYLNDRTILRNPDSQHDYQSKQFALVEVGDTVFYDLNGNVTEVIFQKNK